MDSQLPIVLLPGVMGSRLYFPNSQRFWDPDRLDRMVRWAPVWPFRSDDDNRRALHGREPAGVVLDTGNVTAAERDRGWSTLIWSYYGSMLRRLQHEASPAEVHAVGYDWRQDIRWLGHYAAVKFRDILQQTGADKIAVVTHSMGGLVTRSALLQNADLRDRIAVVVHICQPSAGAVILYRRLFTGLVRGLDGGLSEYGFRLLLGNTQSAFLANMSGLPGAMQLLPSQFFPVNTQGQPWNSFLGDGGLTHDQLYGNPNSPPGLFPTNLNLSGEILDDLRDRVTDVADFHAFLGQPHIQGPPNTWLIYGTGRTTEMRLDFSSGPQPNLEPQGDEVVPDLSATALQLPAGQMIAVNDLRHSDACTNHGVQYHVVSILWPGTASRAQAVDTRSAPLANRQGANAKE